MNNASIAKVFFCTGARNNDLLQVFDSVPVAMEYDERMASFKALGLCKALRRPTVICTTSGTAVAECVPAMLEALYSEQPLVLVSGDRPKKLHGTGSPQTVDHELLTRACRGSYFEMNLDEFTRFSLENVKFPVHVNVLIDDTVPHSGLTCFHTGPDAFEDFLLDKKRPLFLFSHEAESMRTFVLEFKGTGLPFYAETLSGARDLSPLRDEQDLLHLFETGQVDALIRVGHTPLSKLWRLIEKRPLPVFSFDSRGLPALSFGEVLPLSSKELLYLPAWWKTLSMLNTFEFSLPESKLLHALKANPQSEPALIKELHDLLAPGSIVYLGNSLVIRFFELIQTKELKTYANRGVNGIDGQLATAIGLAQSTKEKVYCLLGDITTFYDLSSLREMPENLKLIVVNNGGGRIFDMLNLNKRIVMEHDNCFESICHGFNLSYSTEISRLQGVQVLELRPKQGQTEAFFEEWKA